MPTDHADKKPSKAKKSETLEVRIPYETKQAFLTACREDGTTASEVVRDSVQTYLDGRERPPITEQRTLLMKLPKSVRHYGPRVAAGGLAAIGLATFAALPSAAAPDFKAQFSRLDVNKDGVLSPDEFLGPKSDTTSDNNVVVETRTITHAGKDAPKPATRSEGVKEEAFTFWLPDELAPPKDGAKEQQHEYKFISRREVKDVKDGEPAPDAKTFTFSLDDLKKREFNSIDANGDGKVTLEEYKARQTAMLTRGFQILDKNGDSLLTEAEYAAIVTPVALTLHADDPDAPAPPPVDIPGLKQASPEQIKSAFARLDANKDARLSLAEYLPPS